MATQAATLFDPSAPALQRVRALIALMLRLLFQPDRAEQVERLCDEAEALFADHFLRGAIALSGRTDITPDTHEAVIVWRGGLMDIRIRPRPGAMHPYHRIILHRWRTARAARIRRALARRSRFSRKVHKVYARAHALRDASSSARHGACVIPPSHTPARIAAPP